VVQALRRGTGGEDEANHHLWRFLAFYTILMTAVYSFLSYKTPWCMLSFLHGMILLAGVGAAAIYRALPGRWLRGAAALLFALGLWHLGAQAYRANFVYQADTRNPYVYGHTSSDFLRMVQRIEEIAEVSGKGRHVPIRVVTSESDCWPLPWYVREFDRVLYSEIPPPEPDTEMIVASPDLEPELDKRLRDTYQKEYYGHRFGVLLTLYVRSDLWEAFMAGRK
jgi:predicted membrane-bound mannosyltransferase